MSFRNSVRYIGRARGTVSGCKVVGRRFAVGFAVEKEKRGGCMLKPRKRLTKREMKEDQFVTRVVQASAFVQQRIKELAVGVGIVLLAVVVVVSVVQYGKHRAAAAADLLAEAEVAKRSGRGLSETVELYAQVLDRYGGTPSGGQAQIGLAEAKLEAGDTEGARDAFEQYLRKHRGDDPLLSYAAWAGVGACFEDEGRYAEAAEHYEAFWERHPKSPYAPQALLESARGFELAGQSEKAREVLQRIVDQYEDAALTYQARRHLKVL